MSIHWTELALTDLDSAYNYVAEADTTAANKIISHIDKALATLSEYPKIGRPGRIKGTRELILSGTSFIIIYRIQEQRIEIVAFLHSSRQWPVE